MTQAFESAGQPKPSAEELFKMLMNAGRKHAEERIRGEQSIEMLRNVLGVFREQLTGAGKAMRKQRGAALAIGIPSVLGSAGLGYLAGRRKPAEKAASTQVDIQQHSDGGQYQFPKLRKLRFRKKAVADKYVADVIAWLQKLVASQQRVPAQMLKEKLGELVSHVARGERRQAIAIGAPAAAIGTGAGYLYGRYGGKEKKAYALGRLAGQCFFMAR